MPFPGQVLECELWILPSGFHPDNRVSRELLVEPKKKTIDPPTIVKRAKKKNKETSINIFSTNAASLKTKLKSFKNELKRCNSSIFTLQETHFNRKGKVAIDNFEIFETIRKGKIKGGTMIGAHKGLNPVLISEHNEPFEILVIEIHVANKGIRVISGYGPQESWTPQQREPFFRVLEEEIVKANLAGKSIVIEADFNSKLGVEYIPNDPHSQDRNGKLLSEIIKRQNLTVANGLVVCEGTITRKRVTTLRTETSAISSVQTLSIK